ncbi:MAG TPA: alpha/beta fold hydrolase [Candidatus Udaeobacter sp.]|jgi:predicted alpha/beta-fold hydrolase|nr:alpha/beta fold hydrolase [Candidatus Udaeobacter sp.]
MAATLKSVPASPCDARKESFVTPYRAPYWLPGGHLQTIYAYYLPQLSSSRFRRERWETPDGDFIDLDWIEKSADSPKLVALFHGLEGCSRSHYALSLANEVRRQGWWSVIAHFRGCSGEFNLLSRGYHAGDSAEIDWILRSLKKENPNSRLYGVGISMGGNDLLKWLGEQGDRALDVIDGAVAVSAPVDLQIAAEQLDFGWNKLIYTRDFLRTMRKKVLHKMMTHGLPLDAKAVRAAATFREFDNLYTAPIHGFRDAKDYWIRSSSKPWLRNIQVPTLLINARNDPFFPGDCLPTPEEVSDAVSLEYPDSGGHVGFVSGKFPGHLGWLPRRILDFFA